MTTRYFKLVSLHDRDWLAAEFKAGRVRFGWSWPGTDLRKLREKDDLTNDERITWRYTKFLIERLEPGDRIVCQFEQPLREFWIGALDLLALAHTAYGSQPGFGVEQRDPRNADSGAVEVAIGGGLRASLQWQTEASRPNK